MVAIKGSYTTNQGLEMKADAYKAFKKMRKAAKADGIRFKICSAYRTYSTQKWLYNNYLNTMGKKLRDIRSAYPGRSEHHTGYAIDLVTKSTGWTLTQATIMSLGICAMSVLMPLRKSQSRALLWKSI